MNEWKNLWGSTATPKANEVMVLIAKHAPNSLISWLKYTECQKVIIVVVHGDNIHWSTEPQKRNNEKCKWK